MKWNIWVLFFVFKQKTVYEMRISDWSSDVCSSDLDGGTGLPHTFLHASSLGIQPIDRRFNKHGVMHRRNNSNSFLRRQATRKPEHLRPICLQWKIPQRTRVHFCFHTNTPTDDCPIAEFRADARCFGEVGVSTRHY